MSHDTHNAHGKENTTIISFTNSFWLVVILVGLFIAALNFVQVESAPAGHDAHGAPAHDTHGKVKHNPDVPPHGTSEPSSHVPMEEGSNPAAGGHSDGH